MNREPKLDELIGTETSGAEREQLQRVHELLLEAGPPPELSPELEAGPKLATTLGKRPRPKPRALLLLAAALTLALVFFAGYATRNHGSGTAAGRKPVLAEALKGTPLVPGAQGTIQVWNDTSGHGNWPMTLRVVGLPQLPPGNYYEVYLVRNGKPWGSCGTFRVGGTVLSAGQEVTVTLSAPYSLHKGDTWVVTRPGAGGAEPGQTVLGPANA